MRYFLYGILAGTLLGSFLSVAIYRVFQPGGKKEVSPRTNDTTTWTWPDSLDALVAAADYHKLVFENAEFRLLEVTVGPGQLDPVHTHKGKSIVWITAASPIVYKTFSMDDNRNLILVKQDTIIIKSHELNKGTWENPEPPHSVENIGKDVFRLYRMEYKSTGAN